MIIAALSLAYIAYEVNALYFGSGYLGISQNGYGGLDNNGAGLMLAMGVPLCLAVWDTLRSHWRWFFLALIPVLIHAVLMTYSRGAMVSLIGAAPMLLARSRHHARSPWSAWRWPSRGSRSWQATGPGFYDYRA